MVRSTEYGFALRGAYSDFFFFFFLDVAVWSIYKKTSYFYMGLGEMIKDKIEKKELKYQQTWGIYECNN